jgi:WD40 repeat protein
MIRLWDTRTGAEVLAIRKPWGVSTTFALAFSPDGRRLASGGVYANVTLWDTETGQEVLQVPTPHMIVTSVQFSPDGRRLAAVTNDGAVTVWDAPAVAEVNPRQADH